MDNLNFYNNLLKINWLHYQHLNYFMEELIFISFLLYGLNLYTFWGLYFFFILYHNFLWFLLNFWRLFGTWWLWVFLIRVCVLTAWIWWTWWSWWRLILILSNLILWPFYYQIFSVVFFTRCLLIILFELY